MSSVWFSFTKSIKVTGRTRAQNKDDIILQQGVYAGTVLRKHTIYMKVSTTWILSEHLSSERPFYIVLPYIRIDSWHDYFPGQ